MNKVIKGIKLRLYPNQSQREQLWQMFGNDRFVWNQMLGMAKERYQNNPNSLFVNEYGMNYLLKQLKCEYAFANASWYQFRAMLEYKCAWYGRQLVVVKPDYTSQICSNCGFSSGKKPLEVREWTCPKCGIHHDRDVNAAVNILHKGLKAIGQGLALVK